MDAVAEPSFFRKYRKYLVISAAAGAFIGAAVMTFILFLAPAHYQASIELHIPVDESNPRMFQNDYELCCSSKMQFAVVNAVTTHPYSSSLLDDTSDTVKIESDEARHVIRITIADQSAQRAREYAKAYASCFEVVKGQQAKFLLDDYVAMLSKDCNHCISELEKSTANGGSQEEKQALIARYAANKRSIQEAKVPDSRPPLVSEIQIAKKNHTLKYVSQVAIALFRGALWGIALCLLCIATLPVFLREKTVRASDPKGSSWLDGEAPAE